MDVPENLVIYDPGAVRTMTNAVRLLAVTELYTTQSPRTATDLAELCGVSPSSMSYHLRALESFGIVRRAPKSSDGRERPWLAAARAYTLEADGHLDDRDRSNLIDSYLEPIRARMRGVLARRSRVPSASRDTLFNVLTTGELVLTEEQTTRLTEEVAALFRRYEGLSWGPTPGDEERTDGEEIVRSRYMWSVVPDNPALYNLTDGERAAREDAAAYRADPFEEPDPVDGAGPLNGSGPLDD